MQTNQSSLKGWFYNAAHNSDSLERSVIENCNWSRARFRNSADGALF